MILSLLLLASVFKPKITQQIEIELIEKYKKENPSFDKQLSNKQIIKELPKEDKDTLENLDYYYWYVIILAPLIFLLFEFFKIGKMYGNLRGNSVKLDKNQYPEVHKIFMEMANELGFKKTPELYLVNGDRRRNTYVTCVPGYRNFPAIYSDILEFCLKNNDIESLKFILGHELGHIKLNHEKWWYIFFTAWMNLPFINYFFGLPLSRAREYSCDKIGEQLSKDSTGNALMIVSVGKYAYQNIDLEEYTKEHFDKPCFWSWIANLMQEHGLVAWRISAIRKKHHAGLIFKNKTDNSK